MSDPDSDYGRIKDGPPNSKEEFPIGQREDDEDDDEDEDERLALPMASRCPDHRQFMKRRFARGRAAASRRAAGEWRG